MYRDSKLTRLLSDALGGNSRTCLIVTGSPAKYNSEESISTLRFGQRAKAIKNKAKVNAEYSIGEYKKMLQKEKQKNKLLTQTTQALKLQLKALSEAAKDYIDVKTIIKNASKFKVSIFDNEKKNKNNNNNNQEKNNNNNKNEIKDKKYDNNNITTTNNNNTILFVYILKKNIKLNKTKIKYKK